MISRGQIYFASLDPIQGREQSGRRPVLIVSSDAINRQPLVIAVIVGTDAAESGLARDTVFLAFQVRSLDHSRFTGPAAGSLSPPRMAEVANALRLTLDL